MNRKILSFFFLMFCLLIQAQEENSLLWKISGNGLKKDSYLYGTMHVSQKIAFHLDDVFYQSLLKSDFVGLESDPSTWLEYIFNSQEELDAFRGKSSFLNSDFYNTPFKLSEPKEQEIFFYLSREDMLLNSILYRNNQMQRDFQEDTFLDMFIYQAGKKNNKVIYSLEDYKTSVALVKKSSNDEMFKEDRAIWLQKKLKKENVLTLMNNAYRDRKIAFLDSLNQAMYNKTYLDNMIYIRNNNIAISIDSIVKKGSLFSAIGAAHLGGEKGVIELLRKKGYKVTPLQSSISKQAETYKKQIEDKEVKVNFVKETSPDKFFTAKVPSKMYELNLQNNTSYLSPDLTNGAYVIITRINTFSKLYGKNVKDENFDKLLYESIPGKILSKKEIEKNGIKGLDIINVTKSGNNQRYQLFFTPIEVLIFKMAGKKDYVKNYGDEFFNSIQFNHQITKKTKISPDFKGFEVEVPNYYSFTNQTRKGNRILQAIDNSGNYFFVKEVSYNDVKYIEEDIFELERIQERFYKNLELEYIKGVFEDKSKNSFVSSSTLKRGEKIYLKTITVANRYYLLGCVATSITVKNSFFNSFKLSDLKYPKINLEQKKDTSLYFSVNTMAEPEFSYLNRRVKKKKNYESFEKSITYTNNANEKVFVKLNKFNDLASFEDINDLWKKNSFSNDLLNLNYKFGDYISPHLSAIRKLNRLRKYKERKGVDKNGFNYYSYYLKDSLSSKAIKIKHVLASGAIYELKTLVDTSSSESKFVKSFFTSFKPKDTVLGKPIFKDKTEQFFKAIKEKDSLATNSYSVVNFKRKHINKIINVLKNYNFEDNQLKIKEDLIKKLAKFKTKKVTNFLNDLYVESFSNPVNQIAVIKSIVNDKSKDSYKRLLKLFEADIPLTSNKYQLNTVFNRIEDSLEIARELYPEILTYATIEEYKKPIYNLLVSITDKELLSSNDYKGFKKQILSQAKIELKRQLAKKSTNNYSLSTTGELLKSYIKLLYPFRKDNNVKVFLKNVEYVKDASVTSTLLSLQLKNSEKYNKELFQKIVEDSDTRGILFSELHKIKRTKFYPEKYKSKKDIYKSLLFKSNFKKELKDTIVYLGNRDFKVNNTSYESYFYKSKPHKNSKNNYNRKWKINYVIVKSDSNKIVTKFARIRKNVLLELTKSIDEVIDEKVEEFSLKDRKRVNLNSRNYGGY